MKNKLIQFLSLIAMCLCFATLVVAQTTTTNPTANTGFFSAENIVSVIIGALVSVGVTQWFKNKTGLVGAGATFAALIVAVIVATIAVVVSSVISGSFSWENVGSSVGTIFTLATVAYRMIPMQTEPTN